MDYMANQRFGRMAITNNYSRMFGFTLGASKIDLERVKLILAFL
jgi:hypothetical protein